MNQQSSSFGNDGQGREVNGFSGCVRAIAECAESSERRHEGRDKRDIRRATFARIDDVDGTKTEIAAHAFEFAQQRQVTRGWRHGWISILEYDFRRGLGKVLRDNRAHAFFGAREL